MSGTRKHQRPERDELEATMRAVLADIVTVDPETPLYSRMDLLDLLEDRQRSEPGGAQL